jgi:hypothetical protein
MIRQLKGMACSLYEVGVRHPARGMLNREWSAAGVLAALDWLKRENFNGCDIYVRPARSTPSRLILIDDLNLGMLSRLQSGPHAAAVVVLTSPENYQAWVKLEDDMPADVRREVARYLARQYEGDPNSADSAHYGRLAGFTNRKPRHLDDAGRSPFVLLDSYNGKSAIGAADLVRIAQKNIEREQTQARAMAVYVQQEARRLPQAASGPHTAKELAAWYQGLWQSLIGQFGKDFDASRADWIAALTMFGCGYGFWAVADAISLYSPGIADRKGASLEDYVIRTAGKAEVWRELKAQGKEFTDVSDALLSLAHERVNKRLKEKR